MLWYLLALTFILRGLCTSYQIANSFKWLKRTAIESENLDTPVTVLIPLYKETKNITDTVDYFLNTFDINVKVVCITTEKEGSEKASTFNLLKDYRYRNDPLERIGLLHYPEKSGFMAHQLNYGLRELESLQKINADSIVTFYNADSRPHPNTVTAIRQMFKSKDVQVAQQVALLTKNYESIGGSKWGSVLQSFALLQTRWSLAHELPRLIRNSKTSFYSKYANAHCIGHGLTVRYQAISNVGGFPENTPTEDLFLGFLFRLKNIAIHPLPFVELADSPTSVYKNLRQKYVWFFGPLLYPYYFYQANKQDFIYKDNIYKALGFVSQGIVSALSWMLSGPLLIIFTVLTFWQFSLFKLIIYLIAIGLLYWIQAIQSLQLVKYYQSLNGKTAKSKAVLLTPFVAILHSLPAFFTCIVYVRYLLFGVQIKKPKTEE
jgi:hypothetical protein